MALSRRNFTDEELEVLANKLEELLVERIQINIGKAILSTIWKWLLTAIIGVWSWFYLSHKGS